MPLRASIAAPGLETIRRVALRALALGMPLMGPGPRCITGV
jgi:hypothetical protein